MATLDTNKLNSIRLRPDLTVRQSSSSIQFNPVKFSIPYLNFPVKEIITNWIDELVRSGRSLRLPKNWAWLMVNHERLLMTKLLWDSQQHEWDPYLKHRKPNFHLWLQRNHRKFFYSTKSIFQSTQGKLNSCEKCFRSHTCGRDIAIENGRWRTLALQYQEISRAFFAARAWIYK